MTKNDSPTATAAVAVTPPPVKRGRAKAPVDEALIASMRELVENGDWASDGKTYPDKPSANKAIVVYKGALKDAGVTSELTSRSWDAESGEGILIAISRKGD